MGKHYSMSDLDAMEDGTILLVDRQIRSGGVMRYFTVPLLKVNGQWFPPGCLKPVHDDPVDLIDGFGQPDTGTVYAESLSVTANAGV